MMYSITAFLASFHQGVLLLLLFCLHLATASSLTYAFFSFFRLSLLLQVSPQHRQGRDEVASCRAHMTTPNPPPGL